jgi:hypothetical protein
LDLSIKKTLKYSIHDSNQSRKAGIAFVASIDIYQVQVNGSGLPFISSQGLSYIELVQHSLVFSFQSFEFII